MKEEHRKGLLLILKEKEEDLIIQQQIQQKASQIASEQKLGALQKEYHTQCRTGPLPATTLQVLSLLFSCWLIFLYVSRFVPALQAFSSFSASFAGLFFFLGPVCLIFCILISWSYWSNYPFRHSREFLYEHGFLLIACRNEHIIGSEAIHWSEVGAIRYHFSHNSDADSTDESYTLQYANGRTTFGNHVCEPKRKQRLPHDGPYRVVKNTSHDASLCEYHFPPELGRQIEAKVFPSPVSCNPLRAGRFATIRYSGWLAGCSLSLTLHWGYNGWNHIVDTRMTNQHNGIWQATLLIPSEASIVNMAFFNQDNVWDNKDSDNYNLNVL